MNKKTFCEIAGYEKEKNELSSLAKLLKNNKKLKQMGGKMPHGLLLIGENGVGKTVMAKAFINESSLYCTEVNHSLRGEEFDSHIHDVFSEAVKNKPSIIFIEELDKIAAQRDPFSYGNNFDRFNTLLSNINSISEEDDIFILATANQRMRIDGSLIRSGRIDSVIQIGLPNQGERTAIFKHYCECKAVETKLDILSLSKATKDFSGADIEAVMNDAAINACKENRNTITKKDIEASINNKKFGILEKNSELTETYQRVVATHEAGHALMMLFGPHKNINRVTILPRGYIRGYAEMQFQEDKMQSIAEKENLVAVSLGGMAAERVFYGTGFNGSSSDLIKAQNIIHSLICQDGIEGYNLLVKDNSLFGDGDNGPVLSQKKLELIESKETEVFERMMNETINAINRHKKLAMNIIQALMTKKVLEKDELEFMFNEYMNTLDKKEKKEINANLKRKYDINWDGKCNITGGARLDAYYE